MTMTNENYTMPKLPWHKRVKNSIKEREITKTVASHWTDHKETYVVTAIAVAATFLATKKSTSSSTLKQFSLFGGNTLVVNDEAPQKNHAL